MKSENQKICLAFAAGAVIGVGLDRLLKRTHQSAKVPKLTLHLYDHCPWCIRVELVLGWKGIPYERKVYGYGDSLGDPNKGLYYGGVTLTGKKQLPVLEIEGKPLMPESGDIIGYLERLQGPGKVLLASPSNRKDLNRFFKDPTFKNSFDNLTRPVKIKMTHLKDWGKSEDIDYARTKYEGLGFNYAEAEASVEKHLNIMNGLLEQLNDMVYSSEQLSEGSCALSWDDVLYLPTLRTLTVAKGLKWPEKLRSYVVNALKKANVGSYFYD